MTICGGYIQMVFFLRTFVVSKLWMLIFSSNQDFLEHVRALSYSPQNNLSNGVLHALIKDHLTLILRVFVIKSQIPNWKE
jgi:hypothetical protein